MAQKKGLQTPSARAIQPCPAKSLPNHHPLSIASIAGRVSREAATRNPQVRTSEEAAGGLILPAQLLQHAQLKGATRPSRTHGTISLEGRLARGSTISISPAMPSTSPVKRIGWKRSSKNG